MITEWNYRTPLTCDEACELEEFRMLNDLKEKSERRDFYSKIGGTELSEEKIEKATFGKEFEIFYLENYRLKLHERVPALTTDEIENISIYALDLVRSKKEIAAYAGMPFGVVGMCTGMILAWLFNKFVVG